MIIDTAKVGNNTIAGVFVRPFVAVFRSAVFLILYAYFRVFILACSYIVFKLVQLCRIIIRLFSCVLCRRNKCKILWVNLMEFLFCNLYLAFSRLPTPLYCKKEMALSFRHYLFLFFWKQSSRNLFVICNFAIQTKITICRK